MFELTIYFATIVCLIFANQCNRLYDSSLRAKVEIIETRNLSLHEFFSLLGSLSIIPGFLVGFFLFRWWWPLAVWIAALALTARILYKMNVNPEAAMRLHPITHILATAGTVSLWLAFFRIISLPDI